MYTDRMELGEDQVYRWHYEEAYGQDGKGRKWALIFLAATVVLTVVMWILIPEKADKPKLQLLVLPAAALFFLGREWLINSYRYRQRGGTNYLRYELDSEKVKILHDNRTTPGLQKVGRLTMAEDVLTGHASLNTDLDLLGVEYSSVFMLDKVKKIVFDPDREMIELRRNLQRFTVYVPYRDFNLLKEFILAHTNDTVKVKNK